MDKASTANFWTFWPPNEVKALTLKAKAFASTTADTFESDVACTTCRKTQPTREQLLDAGILAVTEAVAWEVWDRGQARFPLPGDTLVENANSTQWIVSTATKAVFENVHICVCTKAY